MDGEMEPAEPVKANGNIPEEIYDDMVNLWKVFEMEHTDKVPISELRVIMRALDFDLNDEQLEHTRKQIDPKNTNIITFENLFIVMEDKLKDVDTYEDMIIEFKKLDKDKDGKIPAPEFK
jgi:Ca2+-binding EF-hand superfamily protein